MTISHLYEKHFLGYTLMMRNLKYLKIWLLLGWMYVGMIILFSLISTPPKTMDFHNADKLEHFLAYAAMMFWFGLIYLPGNSYHKLGVVFIILGIVLEFIQGQTGYRALDFFDMIANSLGVFFGYLLAGTRFSSVLLRVESKLERP